MLAEVLLYATPVLGRVALTTQPFPPAWRVLLSLVPLLVVVPSIRLPRWVADERREHVGRHAIYALAFTVSAATSVRWDVVGPALVDGAEWARPLVAYLIIGTATLWWFCASHVLENRGAPLHTHQGDVAVLPLTLVAIATFHYAVPDEAFQFSRSLIYYVPIVVAWATLHFVAFNGFATSQTTTHSTQGFYFLAHAGLVVAVAHLTLLEARSPPLAFQILPLVASFLCQATTRPTAPPTLRPKHALGTVGVAAGLGAALGTVLRARFGGWAAFACATYGSVTVALAVRPLAGARWVGPATLYAALVTGSLLRVTLFVDALLLVGGYFVVLALTSLIAPAVYAPSPPAHAPPQDAHSATPQENGRAARTFALLTCPLPGGQARSAADAARALLHAQDADPACPAAFRGVWWAQGTALPTPLLCVHRGLWEDTGGAATLWNRRIFATQATLGGWVHHVGAWISTTQLTVLEGGRWIRTDAWCFGPLRLFASTMWLWRVGEDEMLRLIFDTDGRVVWQYRLKRVLTGRGTRTRFHHEWEQEQQQMLLQPDAGRWWVAG
tara:strand:- start:9410 stop:11077 length:1668 start_codon:yes stop_codon:yes gene_type:complete